MYYVPEAFLKEKEAYIAERSGGLSGFTLSAEPGPADRVLVDFHDGGLHNVVSSTYENEDRCGFYLIQYWQVIAPFLLKIRHRFPHIRGRIYMWIDDVCPQPGMVFTVSPKLDQFALPDPYYLRSEGYEATRRREITLEDWTRRSRTVFWRGVSTGYRTAEHPKWSDLPRFRLCKAANLATTPGLLDVGVSGIVQMQPEEAEEILSSGLMKERVPQDEFEQYRATIDIDGNANSWDGPFIKLQFGNTLLKVRSQHGYEQWFYDRFREWVHFIPVSHDMSDLIDIAQWVQNNEQQAYEIALNGQRFVNALTVENVLQERGLALCQYLERSSARLA